MIRILSLVAILMALAMPSMAQTVKVEGLSREQIQEQIKELTEQAKNLKDLPKTTAETVKDVAKAVPGAIKEVSAGTREELSQWSNLGAGVGKAMIATAKELGMAADEFSGTGLGKFVLFLILFKMIGKSIVGIVFGVSVMTIAYRAAFRLVRPYKVAEYTLTPVFWGLFSWRRVVRIDRVEITTDQSENRTIGACIIAAVGTLIGTIAIFANM